MYEIDGLELKAIERVIHSKKLFRYQAGNNGECDQFEKEFASYMGTNHAVMVTSGTNALIAALMALDIGEGDEVLVPAYTFFATAAAVRSVGARTIIVNINSSLSIDLEDAAARCTDKTKAIIPVHMDGLSNDMKAITDFAKSKNLRVIEDCAQALGGSFAGKRLGTWGDVGCFSFNEMKNLSCGEGGIAVTADPELYEKLFCAQDLSARFNPVKKSLFSKPPPFLGLSMRVSEIQGAIMRVQLSRLDGILSRLRERKSMMIRILSQFKNINLITPAKINDECGSSLHFRCANPLHTAELAQRLAENRIIAIPPGLRPAHVAWKWMDAIEAGRTAEQNRQWLSSMSILANVLKFDIDPNITLDATMSLALQMAAIVSQTLNDPNVPTAVPTDRML